MNDSMAQPGSALDSSISGWKVAVSWSAAVVISALFLVSGLWKIGDVPGWTVRVTQLLIPQQFGLAAALAAGVTETFAAVLILVPRFRRWGAWLCGLLLVVFMVYFAINYDALRGAECSCFPWVKRVVGPAFFIGDAVMLGLAAVAGWWARPSSGLRNAGVILGALAVFALVSYGVEANRHTGVKAPDSIMVDGKPFSLREGKILIYYFDPECMHCADAAKRMSKMQWGSTKIVLVAVQQARFAQSFINDTGLHAPVSSDFELLKKTFPFQSAPAAVALEDGYQKASLTMFDQDEPGATLKKLGFIE